MLPTNPPTSIRLTFGPGFHAVGYQTDCPYGFRLGLGSSEIAIVNDHTGKLTESAWRILRKFGSHVRPFKWGHAKPAGFTSDYTGSPSFAIFTGPKCSYLMLHLRGHRALWIDASVLGSPLEQAIWALETRFPNNIRFC